MDLGQPVTSRGVYTTPIEIDPFGIAPEEKLALLLGRRRTDGPRGGISARTGNLIFIRERKSLRQQ